MVGFGLNFGQCLLHRPSFQHLIAAALAAPVVFFAVQFTISQAGFAVQTLPLIVKFLRKSYVAKLFSSAVLAKHVQRELIPEPSERQTSALTNTLPALRITCVKMQYLSRINEKKAI